MSIWDILVFSDFIRYISFTAYKSIPQDEIASATRNNQERGHLFLVIWDCPYLPGIHPEDIPSNSIQDTCHWPLIPSSLHLYPAPQWYYAYSHKSLS